MGNALRNLQELLIDRQYARILRLTFPHHDGPRSELLVNKLEADEGLSRDFEFTVELLSNDASLDLKDLQGKLLSVELVRNDGEIRYFTGYVFSFRFVKTDGDVAFYEAALGPWLKYLDLRRNCFLFHDATLYDQTRRIFGDYQALPAWDFRGHGDHPPMTEACQFNESDYNYLSRRWEAAGWHYAYEHTAKGHKLILGDDSTGSEPIDGVTIDLQRHTGSQEENSIGEWSARRHIVPASVALSSFDFKAPRPRHVDVPTRHEQGMVLRKESHDYAGAYGFKDRRDGERLAALRMEELEHAGKIFEGTGNNRNVVPGRWFRLTGRFYGGNNEDREFLIISVRHSASNNYHVNDAGPPHYENRITCIRKVISWRPGPGFNSVEPKIYGLQTAIVVGPKGEEIHTDEYGRVRVQFHWDREGRFDERSSAWLRVATAWAGPNFGMTSIPRIGAEVIVQFLDGNPDRGLITGMVPNADNMPPWPLPANKTQSGILSRSTPNGSYGNANALRFEDMKGKEQLWLHAERDQLTEVEHDEDKWVGNDRRKTIDRDETSHIGHDRTETVGNDETIAVHNDRKETVDRNETIAIGGNRVKSIGRNRKDDIGKNWSTYVARMKTETVGMAYLQNVGMGRMENVGLAYNLNVGTIMATVVGINQITKVGKAISITAGEELSITVGLATLKMTADGKIFINGSQISVDATGPLQISGKDVDIN
ncbi:type VI secretion system Vgr family protein [Massilia luteola]|uniref:type VI secretion system Vgr family protein n=1 Tax=Massilia luteola TaxID=3081751 RepID=UPI002ACC3767|nr:type VI secretion system tip protein TssI/VgrG [Massilia sp. Gc5]